MHSIRKPTRTFCSTRGLRLRSLKGTRVVLRITLEVSTLCAYPFPEALLGLVSWASSLSSIPAATNRGQTLPWAGC